MKICSISDEIQAKLKAFRFRKATTIAALVCKCNLFLMPAIRLALSVILKHQLFVIRIRSLLMTKSTELPIIVEVPETADAKLH